MTLYNLHDTKAERLAAIERKQRTERQAAVEKLFTEYPGDWSPVQAHIVGLAVDNECPACQFDASEYTPLIDAGLLQLDTGWLVIKRVSNRAVRTDGFDWLPEYEQYASEQAEMAFEDSARMKYLVESGKVQR